MKKLVAVLLLSIAFWNNSQAQNPINWTPDQLLEPAELAKTLTDAKLVPAIYAIGPGALIPTSVAIGPTTEKDNLETFKKQVSKLPKETPLVIYCGCCPFEHCPNVRPAMAALKELRFTNYKLLNLSHNLKTDWISKGYPTVK